MRAAFNGLHLRVSLSALVIALGLALPATASAALPGGYSAHPVTSPTAGTGDRFGEAMAVGDVTGDGIVDLVVGAPGVSNAPLITGRVYAIDGATGGSVWGEEGAHGPNPQQETKGTVETGFGTAVAVLGDVGSCGPSASCQIGQPDGAAEVVVSAPGGDAGGLPGADQGIVYVLDGKSGRTMKRLAIHPDDWSPLGPSGFGSSLLVPSGLPPCEGNGGIGACPDLPQRVAVGDLDGGGKPDILVGAPQFGETLGTNEFACSSNCPAVGKIFMFRGEDITGSDQMPMLTRAEQSISYFEPTDGTSPEFGAELRALGDVGACTADATSNAKCYGELGEASNQPDGAPDLLVQAPGVEPGAVYVVDGARMAALTEDTSFADAPIEISSGAAFGDLGGTPLPDMVLSTPDLDGSVAGQGAAWALEADVVAPDGFPQIGRLDDPAPVTDGGFAAVVAPLGDVAGDAQGEVAILRAGGTAAVHIFSACKSASLQRIDDPAGSADTAFGASILPVGDVNFDGYPDIAVSDPLLNGTGVVHLFVSNAAAGPAFAGCNPPPPSGGGGTGGGPAATPSAPPSDGPVRKRTRRTLVIHVNRRILRSGRSVKIYGTIRTGSKRRLCRARQKVAVQRLISGTKYFQTFDVAVSTTDGKFSVRTKPDKTYTYRLRVQENNRCESAVSRTTRVVVAGGL